MQGTKGHPDEFPYDAVNPQTGKKMTFDSMDDVYKVLFQCYDECINKGFKKLGEALYQESLFFVNDEKLIDKSWTALSTDPISGGYLEGSSSKSNKGEKVDVGESSSKK